MKKIKIFWVGLFLLFCAFPLWAQNEEPIKPRVLVSTDIGGTDADDNQSMIHLLMYSDLFEIEGLVSSPSYGNGSEEEIMRMIGIYEKDYPVLKKQIKELDSPEYLRGICKQGRRGLASFAGFDIATEGSEWIVSCARKQSNRPLWILVWGGLDDLAQALHDAPDILPNIRVYWIGGPNKKWSVNSYAYVAKNFPDLWIIENNASYRGFISDNHQADKYNKMYYDRSINGAGCLGADFRNYYQGNVKMGDTPSLLYMMDGDPENPYKDSWGGSFERMTESPMVVFTRNTTLADTVPVYAVVEYRLSGPQSDMKPGTKCFVFNIAGQNWDGIYFENGIYAVKYSPKAPEILQYKISSDIPELNNLSGSLVVDTKWPGKACEGSYKLGEHWFTDKSDPALFSGKWQGFKTVEKWRNVVLDDWSGRWQMLKRAALQRR